MKKVKTEILILVTLWIVSLTTYSIALMNDYVLYTSDYLGLIGLIVVSTISFFRPEKLLGSILILLILGLLNILSFAYFINLVMTFNITLFVTPGIQFISLGLLIILIIKKPQRFIEYYRETFGYSEQEREEIKQLAKERFKERFEKLSDEQIEINLKEKLVPEAIAALNEIKEERQNKKTHYNMV
jgi:hypothetical protein